MVRRQVLGGVLAATTTLAVGVVAAVVSPAAANPVGIANTQVNCTSTISTQLSSLTVQHGFVCIDGADGGGVNGPVTVAAGAGLYIEMARVGSINAVSPTAVWGCDATTGNVNVSGATGVQVQTYYGDRYVITVSFNAWCLPFENSTGSNLTGSTGSVRLVNDAGLDSVDHTNVNGTITDIGNRSYNLPEQPTNGSVELIDDTVSGAIQLQNPSLGLYIGGVNVCCDSSLFRGPVTITSATTMQIALGTFDKGLTLTSDSGPGIIAYNAFHGQIAFNGTNPDNFEIADNSYF